MLRLQNLLSLEYRLVDVNVLYKEWPWPDAAASAGDTAILSKNYVNKHRGFEGEEVRKAASTRRGEPGR